MMRFTLTVPARTQTCLVNKPKTGRRDLATNPLSIQLRGGLVKRGVPKNAEIAAPAA